MLEILFKNLKFRDTKTDQKKKNFIKNSNRPMKNIWKEYNHSHTKRETKFLHYTIKHL